VNLKIIYYAENTIKLPTPQKDLQFPLMKALEKRRSIRKWKNDVLSDQGSQISSGQPVELPRKKQAGVKIEGPLHLHQILKQ